MKCREMPRNAITLEMTELTRGKTTQRVEISDTTVQSYATIAFLKSVVPKMISYYCSYKVM